MLLPCRRCTLQDQPSQSQLLQEGFQNRPATPSFSQVGVASPSNSGRHLVEWEGNSGVSWDREFDEMSEKVNEHVGKLLIWGDSENIEKLGEHL